MPTGAELDGYAALAQQVIGPHDVVDAFHLMVDMLHARIGRREQRDLVMDLVDAQQRRIADAVADLRAQQAGPEFFVAARVERAQADVAETRNARIARRKITPAAVMRGVDEFDVVARGILERDELARITLLGIAGAAARGTVAVLLERDQCMVQLIGRIHLESRRVVVWVAFEIDQRVVAAVGPQMDLLAGSVGHFQAQHVGRVAYCRVEIRRTQPDIPDVVQMNHSLSPGMRVR